MAVYTYDDIETFKFDDTRSFKRTVENGQYIKYNKQVETVTFKDGKKGMYVSVFKEVHEEDDYDSMLSDEVVKQSVFTINGAKQADDYFMSDSI